jgi:hypothetical protein
MKTLTRIALVFFAGLALTGCASKSAKIDSPTAPKLANRSSPPPTPGVYWLQRDLTDKSDRALGTP